MRPTGINAALIVAAGSGSRAGGAIPKQFRLVNGQPMLHHSVQAFDSHSDIGKICVVLAEGQEAAARKALPDFENILYAVGGATRRESVNNGLLALKAWGDIATVFVHDAARPFLPPQVIDDLLTALTAHKGAVPAMPVVDSLARSSDGINLTSSESRDGLWRIQTPQAFQFDAICAAHASWPIAAEATDDARMAMAAGYDVAIVPGAESLSKFTFASDFERKAAHSMPMQLFRTGTGYDVHRLAAGEELWLCGIQIPYEKGLAGHSDADVALHALTDAILGAAALGDIGDHFPPSDPKWRGVSSDLFLSHAAALVADNGYAIGNVDVTIICEAPKIGPHRYAMRERVSNILKIPIDFVSIKATTTEKLGYTGRGEGIAAQAIATLMKDN